MRSRDKTQVTLESHIGLLCRFLRGKKGFRGLVNSLGHSSVGRLLCFLVVLTFSRIAIVAFFLLVFFVILIFIVIVIVIVIVGVLCGTSGLRLLHDVPTRLQ
jgi:hypothetical protein